MSGSLAPCAVRRVELTQPLSPLAVGEQQKGLLALFEWDGLPLGSRLFTQEELPVPASAVANLAADAIAPLIAAIDPEMRAADPAQFIAEEVRRGADLPERVSVIVCTRHRSESLARCLASLQRLAPAPDEIIVVDNGPERPETRAVVSRFEKVRYIAEPHPGLSRARNTGIAHATGEILAFTDDDVEVTPPWIAMLKAGFADAVTGCVTGVVVPAELDSEAAFIFEIQLDGLQRGFLPRSYDVSFLDTGWRNSAPLWSIGAGANMAIRQIALQRAGLFDERLGAGAAGCSEDTELWHRLLLAGWTCRYQPLACVFHHHRGDEAALAAQMRAYMRGHASALFEQFAQTRRPGNLGRAFVTLPWYYIKLMVHLALAGPSLRRRILGAEVRGLVEAPGYWLRHRREPKFSSTNSASP